MSGLNVFSGSIGKKSKFVAWTDLLTKLLGLAGLLGDPGRLLLSDLLERADRTSGLEDDRGESKGLVDISGISLFSSAAWVVARGGSFWLMRFSCLFWTISLISMIVLMIAEDLGL